MKVLLDTHTFIWGIGNPERLSPTARRLIASSECFWSVVSIWEALIKFHLGKLPLPSPAGEYLLSQMTRSGVSVLQIRLEHVLLIEGLKSHHGDPFDRLLIAQSLEDGLPIVSADTVFKKYPVRGIW